MRCIRLIIHQNQANYKKYETIDNKMTYPLPPLSTVIGAIHSACGWDYYHDMDLCIAGNYESLNQRIYTDNMFLNSIRDDRYTLVKLINPLILSNSCIKIAEPNASGNKKTKDPKEEKEEKEGTPSFKNKKNIDIYNEELLDEWIVLKNQENSKNKEEVKNTKKKLTIYKALNTSIRRYEILSNINLVIYIKTSEENMECIVDNIYNMKSIGRSEDFIEVLSCEIIDVKNAEKDTRCNHIFNTYVDINLIKNKQIGSNMQSIGTNEELSYGTVYNINKNYIIEENKRKFNIKKLLYVSNIYIAENSEDIFIDHVNGDNIAINFT